MGRNSVVELIEVDGTFRWLRGFGCSCCPFIAE
jgi:hypothetical protein